MKNQRLFLLCFLMLIQTSTFAQGFYANIEFGYGVGTSKHSTLSNYTETDDGNFTIERVAFSLGEGVTYGITTGYMINKNLGFQFTVSRLDNIKNISSTYVTLSFPTLSNQANYNAINIRGEMIRLIPSIILTTEAGKIKPYAKLGLVIGFGNVLIDIDGFDKYGTYTINQTVKANGGVAVGLNTGLGITFSIVKNLTLLSEINLISLDYTPTNNNTTNTEIYIPETYSFSSIGLNLGLVHSF